MKFDFKKSVFIFAIILILLCAWMMRTRTAKFGLPYGLHWDEPAIVLRGMNVLKTNDWNPHFFHYPSFLIYASTGVDILVYWKMMGKDPAFYEKYNELSYLPVSVDLRSNITDGIPPQWNIEPFEFHYANRLLIAFFSMLSLFLFIPVINDFSSKSFSVFALIFLVLSSDYLYHSILVTPNVPMIACVLACYYFSTLFMRSKKNAHCLLSIISAGFAVAMKYNAVLCLIFPLHSLWINRTIKRKYLFLLSGLTLIMPAMILLMTSPYILLDIRTFVEDFGFEMYHYHLNGHFQMTVEKGLPHFMRMVEYLATQITLLPFLFAAAGFVIALMDRYMRAIPVFMTLYIYSMIQFKVFFERNSLVLIPFCLILMFRAGFALYKFISRKEKLKRFWRCSIIFCIACALAISYLSFHVPKLLWMREISDRKETRTRAIDFCSNLNSSSTVAVLHDLNIHTQDLERLQCGYQLFSLDDFSSIMEKSELIILGQYQTGSSQKLLLDELLKKNAYRMELLETCSFDYGLDYMRPEYFSVFPDVYIYKVKN